MSLIKSLLILASFLLTSFHNVVSIDYGVALTKSLLYFEAQRSGKLPPNQRVHWRGDSALSDGQNIVGLVGGYYDAGDNVKFGFPMAFTVTMLAWSVVEFGPKLDEKMELSNALDAIKWGTDYFIRAHPEPNVLYGEVGDGNSDHVCWQRPEDMTTPRTCYKIDEQNPGADLAGETAAAFAAAAIAFNGSNSSYSSQLLSHAKQVHSNNILPDILTYSDDSKSLASSLFMGSMKRLDLFDFATNHHGLYQTSIPVARQFYPSSGFEDELLWAAAWLHRATNEQPYLDYINHPQNLGGTRSMFSWDDKYVGTQILITKSLLEGKLIENKNYAEFKGYAEQYICNCIQKGSSNVEKTSAGLLWWQPWNNLQYVTAALFVITTYADILQATNNTVQCQGGSIIPEDLLPFARSLVDHILGSNPKGLSYMVGFGSNFPQKVHHRGASIVSIKTVPRPVTCQGGFEWFSKDAPNPNILDGAIVGGPDLADNYSDSRSNYMQNEPATGNTAPFVGVLARLA